MSKRKILESRLEITLELVYIEENRIFRFNLQDEHTLSNGDILYQIDVDMFP